MTISTSVWGTQHLNAGQNIEHKFLNFIPKFHPLSENIGHMTGAFCFDYFKFSSSAKERAAVNIGFDNGWIDNFIFRNLSWASIRG